jgi:hypothetical protein
MWSLITIMLLAGCVPTNPFARPSAIERWRTALMRADYAAAEQIVTGEHVAAWSRETQQLTQQHGRIEAYGRADGLLSDRTMLITRIKLAWQDGTALCFRVQQTEADTLQLLDQHCQDCATPEQDDPAYQPPPNQP